MSIHLKYVVALALVGWYLMTPIPEKLPDGGWKVDTAAPLSEWIIGSAFDSAKECEEGRAWVLEHSKKVKQADPAHAEAELYSQCIASDDPRLK